ncbi:hypothetical protein SH668x_003433 [Planctomicrobium sp. SH668]|uniref:hypothetical protein n=1 Tax=Planctomicrobium sp. SH668 TaxID=3448126 RepID=UPI003F5B8C16
MAASSKPTAVHFSLAISVMITLILGLVCYMMAKENQKLALAEAAARTTASTSDNALRKVLDEITLLKKKLGYTDFEAVGAETDNTPNSVIGSLNRDLALYGKEYVQPSAAAPTVAATLQSLRAALNSQDQNNIQRQAQLEAVRNELAQEVAAHANRVAEISASQTSSEAQLTDVVTTKNELLAQKDGEIAKFRDLYNKEQRDREALKDELESVRKVKDAEIQEFENIVRFQRGQLASLENQSFDKPDGLIVRVENTTRTVWINLGSDDGLRTQVSFSVYTRSNQGFGRGSADIKGKIEVIEILGPHLARANIIKDDVSRPIQANDPIYSPIWTKGNKEFFSFVGIVDIDGDGKSDREYLHTILNTAGSDVEVEIDDQGNRVPEGSTLSVKSKFLVIGKIEDPTDFPGSDTEKQEQISKVREEHRQLVNDALRRGVKVITFNDFLNYIGYEQQSIHYDANSKQKFNLRNGAQTRREHSGVGNSSGSSTGQTSKRFDSSSKK